ncbi:hypothetical protein SAMN05421781_2531 [Marinococcus luteus]|uniref:Uncharacterized protein n=1 Tax=Marinococcus luteus TaxID=1122204 RepID=A0A1H2WWF8_9BACI|nr:hypothetical protein [Marinococcus luteus]SDW84993.1 hypothetical protein SAMN05421781_2531 [Marinococcus luteus]
MQEYRLTKIKLEHSGKTISISRGSLTVYNDEANIWYAEIEQPSEVELLQEWKKKDTEEEVMFFTEGHSARIGYAEVTRVTESSSGVSVSFKGAGELRLVGSN